MFVLAIDQGTTNTKALVFDGLGQIVRQASASCRTDYPQPGWAEQSAQEIWTTTQQVIAEACRGLEQDIKSIGVSNQRETLVVWDGETGEPLGPAPIWQCRRTTQACAKLIEAGLSDEVAEITGLGINPLFPASKLAWILNHRLGARTLHDSGRLRAGTVDAWLLWNLTGGGVFATDHSNASRTLLFDINALAWSPRLSEIFGVPLDCLPQPMASNARFGETAQSATTLPPGVAIHAMMGDSHAALYGHGVRAPGRVKATYGTGSSLMTLTEFRAASKHGLSGTIAWTEDSHTALALEGNITVSAQAAAFMAEMMGLSDPAALSDLAQKVEDSDGVHFVPALAGLGAPHWDDEARGVVSGLSLGSKPAHLARATIEAIAHQIADVFDAIEQDLGHTLDGLSADGGASANPFLMQLQADLLGRPVERLGFPEIGASGVARMSAKAAGLPMAFRPAEKHSFMPAISEADRQSQREAWRAAVRKIVG
ncbi:MAG: FGGY-family carbohydrate kinase [Alphaproteobacteria bacterium]|nr:FGGY-family carbohydrate kinase [Alphaproteobacteria bacterium]